jgi:hypothetical protein
MLNCGNKLLSCLSAGWAVSQETCYHSSAAEGSEANDNS